MGTMDANHGDVVVADNKTYNRDGAFFRFSVLMALMRGNVSGGVDLFIPEKGSLYRMDNVLHV